MTPSPCHRRRRSRPLTREAFPLWEAIFGPQVGLLGLYSALREPPHPGRPNKAGRLTSHRQRFYAYPAKAPEAYEWCLHATDAGREAFYCVHLLTGHRRVKENAAPVRALWAEADGADGEDISAAPEPSAIVESSPGRRHLFWRLTRPLDGPAAELLNRRLARATGADPAGWDLSQGSRPPGTRNLKYEDPPVVRLLFLDADVVYHPRELDLALPDLPDDVVHTPLGDRPAPSARPGSGSVDLSALSAEMRELAQRGNRAASRSYASRSEADFALAVAMFGKGYPPEDVSAVLLDPTLGISEKSLSEGPNAAHYVSLTVDRARRAAAPADPNLARPSHR